MCLWRVKKFQIRLNQWLYFASHNDNFIWCLRCWQESYGLAGTDRDDVSPADSLKSPASRLNERYEGKNVSRWLPNNKIVPAWCEMHLSRQFLVFKLAQRLPRLGWGIKHLAAIGRIILLYYLCIRSTREQSLIVERVSRRAAGLDRIFFIDGAFGSILWRAESDAL